MRICKAIKCCGCKLEFITLLTKQYACAEDLLNDDEGVSFICSACLSLSVSRSMVPTTDTPPGSSLVISTFESSSNVLIVLNK